MSPYMMDANLLSNSEVNQVCVCICVCVYVFVCVCYLLSLLLYLSYCCHIHWGTLPNFHFKDVPLIQIIFLPKSIGRSILSMLFRIVEINFAKMQNEVSYTMCSEVLLFYLKVDINMPTCRRRVKSIKCVWVCATVSLLFWLSFSQSLLWRWIFFTNFPKTILIRANCQYFLTIKKIIMRSSGQSNLVQQTSPTLLTVEQCFRIRG